MLRPHFSRLDTRSRAPFDPSRLRTGSRRHAKYTQNLSFAVVPDIRTKGAVDDAVKGVDGMVHTTSPFVMSDVEPEDDLLIPAIEGTKNILQSISAHAPQVRHVVLTSSFTAIANMHKGALVRAYLHRGRLPIVPPHTAPPRYLPKELLSIIFGGDASFNIATICPPMVYGPVEHGATSRAKLNTSSADIYRLMNCSKKEVPQTSFYAFCDVRDVAQAHLRAYQTEEAANQRFFVTGGNYSYQVVCDILRKRLPEIQDRVPERTPDSGLVAEACKVDNSKTKRVLAMPRFRSLDESIVDTARSLLEVERSEKSAKA
jgi:nucleoside-diphosphate-sugar epimerase